MSVMRETLTKAGAHEQPDGFLQRVSPFVSEFPCG